MTKVPKHEHVEDRALLLLVLISLGFLLALEDSRVDEIEQNYISKSFLQENAVCDEWAETYMEGWSCLVYDEHGYMVYNCTSNWTETGNCKSYTLKLPADFVEGLE